MDIINILGAIIFVIGLAMTSFVGYQWCCDKKLWFAWVDAALIVIGGLLAILG